jgi:hypothetical protein
VIPKIGYQGSLISRDQSQAIDINGLPILKQLLILARSPHLSIRLRFLRGEHGRKERKEEKQRKRERENEKARLEEGGRVTRFAPTEMKMQKLSLVPAFDAKSIM